MKVMAIDFVRQVLEQTLYEEHLKDNKYFGGKDQVCLFSFYEQLQEDYEVDRYTELYRELVDQQNRSSLIMNGTIIAPETPQIMNVHSHDIIPMTFTCGFRLKLKDRDDTIETINNLTKLLKGRKRDVACFDNGKLLMVGTIANNVLGAPRIDSGCFIGTLSNITDIDNEIISQLNGIKSYLGQDTVIACEYVYFECEDKLYKAIYDSENDIWKLDEGFEYHAKEFTKYKLSLSFDTIKIDQPYTLNASEDAVISFGGSATLVSAEVELGNDLTKISLQKKLIKAKTTINLEDTPHYLEPLEMPNNLGIANELSQLASSNFVQGKQNTGINPTINYSFVLDKTEPLLKQLWKYARYGIQGSPSDSPAYNTGVTPNTIYALVEFWSSWGVIEKIVLPVKATENVEIENTESDVLTLKLNLEVQPNGNGL